MSKRNTTTNTKSKTRPRGNPSGRARVVYGFSFADIARGVRVHSSTLSRIFSGQRSVSLKLAARICSYTGITLERLHKDLYQTGAAAIARDRGTPLA